jgi:uncharacterized protein (DUF302 family)
MRVRHYQSIRSLLFGAALCFGALFSMSAGVVMSAEQNVDGLHIIGTNRTVANVIDRLGTIAAARGLTVFAKINFSADAERSGLKLPPTTLLLLGNPKAGTSLIAAAPTVAIDLPLRVLAWSDAEGKTYVAYDDPEYLQKRHGFPRALIKNISGLAILVTEAVQGAPDPGGSSSD